MSAAIKYYQIFLQLTFSNILLIESFEKFSNITLEEIDLSYEPISMSILKKSTFVKVESTTVDVKGFNLFYLETNPSSPLDERGALLFLHGDDYNSSIWNISQPSILQMSAAAGYRAVAIDLPGYKNTQSNGAIPEDKAEFLHDVIETLDIRYPVIISASLSGEYAASFAMNNSHEMGGFVAVAICCTVDQDWGNFEVPTLIMHGGLDPSPISEALMMIPTKNLNIIGDAPHAIYRGKPIKFMTTLLNYLRLISTEE